MAEAATVGTQAATVGIQAATVCVQVLAADEKESTFATAGGRPLVATSNLHDEDVFGLQLVPQGAFDDVVYVNSCAMILHNFLGQFDYSASTVAHLPQRSDVDLGPVTKVLT